MPLLGIVEKEQRKSLCLSSGLLCFARTYEQDVVCSPFDIKAVKLCIYTRGVCVCVYACVMLTKLTGSSECVHEWYVQYPFWLNQMLHAGCFQSSCNRLAPSLLLNFPLVEQRLLVTMVWIGLAPDHVSSATAPIPTNPTNVRIVRIDSLTRSVVTASHERETDRQTDRERNCCWLWERIQWNLHGWGGWILWLGWVQQEPGDASPTAICPLGIEGHH